MLKIIKSVFGMGSYQKVLYPLQDCSLESIDVRFENTSRVVTKKGHTTITDNTFSKVMDTYETRHNEPHILTMIVCTKPNYDITITSDDESRSLCIEVKEMAFEQTSGPFYIYKEEVKMVDTTKYDHFSVLFH